MTINSNNSRDKDSLSNPPNNGPIIAPEIRKRIPNLKSILLFLKLFHTVGTIIAKLMAKFVPKTTNASIPKKSIKNILIGPNGIPTKPAKYPEIKRQIVRIAKPIMLNSLSLPAFPSFDQVHKFDLGLA